MHLARYIKVALLNRWNLLAFLGAMGFAFLIRADVFCPVVLAAELTYLGLLGTHPKFQAYVDAQAAKAARQEGTATAEQRLTSILDSLPTRSLDRFEALRDRCRELRQIALQIKDPARGDSTGGAEPAQPGGLDRLLWIYLRLLFTQYSLEQFLQKTSDAQMQKDIENLERRLKNVADIPDQAQRQKFAKTIEDNLQTCRDRLANYQKAKANCEFIQLEIDRLENKIRSLSELAINRQEPDFISGQVDQVASSMIQTERTMNELEFATGLTQADEAVPGFLRSDVQQMNR